MIAIALCLSFLLALLTLPQQTAAYGEKYSHKMQANIDCSKFPAALSWHVHVTYMLTNDQQIQDAIEFRKEAQAHFAPYLGSDPICRGTVEDPSGRYDNGRLCMIYDHDLTNDTLGPFAVGEWSMWVPVHYYSAVVPWFVQHHGQFSLLVHPNTGCEYEDHSIWSQWVGPAWNMDMSIFTQNTQTNEFDEVVGTVRNPACAPRAQVCGFGDPQAPGYGPQVLCCSGTACACDANSADGACYCR